THYITAESQVPTLRVGSVISLYSSFLERVGNISKESLGDFIIIEITHEVSQGSYYKNRFKAIPATLKALPSPKVRMPLAETQMATVLSNADPQGKGRVRVRMNWQTDGMQTGWVRVMTPDGGSSSDVKSNRGFVFIPEVGDQVLLGFRHGDPARPYVMGSLFNGVTGSGGFAANHKKSLTTRSGSTVTFDDTAHTILLQTTRANKIFVDELNGTITISSAEEVNVNTKNVNINASENMNVNVGKNFTMQVGEQSSVCIEKDSSVSVNGNAMQNVGKDNHTHIAGDHISHIDKDTILNVGGSIKGNIMENATFETKGITTIGAQDRLYIKSNTKVDITKE
ncbi:phage baseplate assembly protein V, partial [Prevotella melaninogenica]